VSKYVKNTDTSDHTYYGQVVSAGTYHLIPVNEEPGWAQDDDLLTDIGSGIAVMAKSDDGNTDISGVSEAISYLRGELHQAEIIKEVPFASKKIVVNGVEKSLFKRVHGVGQSVAAGATVDIDFVVPYPQVKFTGANVFGGELKDTLDFTVHDDASNTYSGAPGSNYQLNQFGFDVELPPDGVYENTSNYDADLYYGMILRCSYTNNASYDKYVAMNVWLHEVK